MDPISILGLVGTALSVATAVTQVISKLSDLKSKYRNVPLQMSTLLGQLYIVRSALDQISQWRSEDLSGNPRYQELAEQIDTSLDCFCPLILTLQQHLEELHLPQDLGMSTRSKVCFIWNEEDLMGYLRLLDCQVNALNLFLQAVQCKTLAEQREFVHDDDSRTILQKAKDCGTSIIGMSDGTSIFSESTNIHTISLEFDFDAVLLGSRAYTSAHRSNLKQAVTVAKLPQPSSSPTTQGPVAGSPIHGPTWPLLPSGDKLHEHEPTEMERFPLEAPQPKVEKPASPKLTADGSPEDTESSSWPLYTGPGIQVSTQLTISHEEAVSPSSPSSGGQTVVPSTFARPHAAAEYRTVVAPTSTLLRALKQTWRARVTKQPTFVPLTGEIEEPGPLKVKLVLLGSSESGKSTLFKGMKLSTAGPFSQQVAESYTEIVWTNIVKYTHAVLKVMETLGIPLQDETDVYHVQVIIAEWKSMMNHRLPPLPLGDAAKAAQLAISINALWVRDAGFREAYRRRGEHQAPENLSYFATHIWRLSGPGYIASQEDILRLRLKTTGITEADFKFDGHNVQFQVFDTGGARSERKKWIHCFEKVDCVAFTVDASAYCRVLSEDNAVNRMDEQFTLWDSIVNSRWFHTTHFCLIFTKIDCLAELWDSHPVVDYLRDFEAPMSRRMGGRIDAYLTYLENRFMSLVRSYETCKRIKLMRADLVHIKEQSPATSVFEYAAAVKFGSTS